jgi:phosphatidate phosphatase APP1
MNRRRMGLWVVAHLLIILGFASSIVNAADSFILVSDIDDTVKISNVSNFDSELPRVLDELVFAGMPELYRQMLSPDSAKQDSSEPRLWFLSCSPRFLKHHLREIMTESKFPKYDLTVRPLDNLSTHCGDFKIDNLKKKYDKSGEKFILIGDDTEQDPEVYADFSKFKQGQVRAVYIHTIKGGKDLQGGIPFVTAYDIAMREFLDRRLSEQQAAAVGNVVLASEDRTLLPDFQACPKEYKDISGLPDSLAALKAKIEARLTEVCKSRQKK